MLFFSMAPSPCALADIYKWSDANGTVHYGDKPPETSQSEKLDIDTQDKSIFQSSGDYKHRQQKLLNVFEEERTIREQKQAEKKQQKEKLDTACKRAGEYEKYYDRASLLYRENKDGTREFMNEDQRQKAEDDLQTFMKKFCGK